MNNIENCGSYRGKCTNYGRTPSLRIKVACSETKGLMATIFTALSLAVGVNFFNIFDSDYGT